LLNSSQACKAPKFIDAGGTKGAVGLGCTELSQAEISTLESRVQYYSRCTFASVIQKLELLDAKEPKNDLKKQDVKTLSSESI
jgi:hypothetical protein